MNTYTRFLFAKNSQKHRYKEAPEDYIFYAPLDGNTRDISSNNNHLSLYPATPQEWRVDPENKKSFDLYQKNLSNSLITQSKVVYNSNVITVSFEIYIYEVGGARRMLYSNESGSGQGSWGVYLGTTDIVGSANYDRLLIYYRFGNNINNIIRVTNKPQLNKWTKVTVVINKNASPQHKAYIDNVQSPLANVASSSDQSNFESDFLRFGTGYIGAVRNIILYNRELSFAEILKLK